MPDTETSATGKVWRISELTAAESRAYKRPKHSAPKFQATGPLGSIIRAATVDELRAAVRRATWS